MFGMYSFERILLRINNVAKPKYNRDLGRDIRFSPIGSQEMQSLGGLKS